MQNQNQQNCPSASLPAASTPVKGAQGPTARRERSPGLSPIRTSMCGSYYERIQPVMSRVNPDYDPASCCKQFRRLNAVPNPQEVSYQPRQDTPPSYQSEKKNPNESEHCCSHWWQAGHIPKSSSQGPPENLKASSAGRATIDVDLSRGPGPSSAAATTKKKSEENVNRGAVRKPFADLKAGKKADAKADVETDANAPCGMTYRKENGAFQIYQDPCSLQRPQQAVANTCPASTSQKENAAFPIYQDPCSLQRPQQAATERTPFQVYQDPRRPQRPQQTAANLCPPSPSQKENIYQDPCNPQRPQESAAQAIGAAQLRPGRTPFQVYQDPSRPQRPQQTAVPECPGSISQKENFQFHHGLCSPQRPQQAGAQAVGSQSRPMGDIESLTDEELLRHLMSIEPVNNACKPGVPFEQYNCDAMGVAAVNLPQGQGRYFSPVSSNALGPGPSKRRQPQAIARPHARALQECLIGCVDKYESTETNPTGPLPPALMTCMQACIDEHEARNRTVAPDIRINDDPLENDACAPKARINGGAQNNAEECPEDTPPRNSTSFLRLPESLNMERGLAARNEQLRCQQFRCLVQDLDTHGVIQDTLDGKKDFNMLSFNLTFSGGCAPKCRPTLEPLSLLEAVNLRINHERLQLKSCLLPSGSKKGATKKKVKIDIKEADKYFASLRDSEVNRAIASLLKAEIIADAEENQEPLFVAEIYKKISQLPGNELNEFQPMNFEVYAGNTLPK